jgi:uncharacterized membrane protein
MDTLITVAMMFGIFFCVVLAFATRNGLFNQNSTEPFNSQQNLSLAMGLALAASVAFWRDQSIMGWAVAAFAAWCLLCGAFGLLKHSFGWGKKA